ncbi:hypothetical protein AW736_20660 [Termitidicoccus mucosus]|uniref:Uncharacterized protein n=2 Tax=Termitidicoccus mucosus TaxID=1184151 RepID=A0A178IFC8_9BACT|nr:hypothetical protein AW736_20660 [Opitutaceae bacterium TSB47]
MFSVASITCEIQSSEGYHDADIENIAISCARDLQLPVVMEKAPSLRQAPRQSLITLHVSAALAINEHRLWCLACRLACFCPDVRVSVLVHSETGFAQPDGLDSFERRIA